MCDHSRTQAARRAYAWAASFAERLRPSPTRRVAIQEELRRQSWEEENVVLAVVAASWTKAKPARLRAVLCLAPC